jgi:hypothetical protein
MSEPLTHMSPFERRRREEILRLALGAASHRRWKRRALKATVACMIAIPILAALVWASISRPVVPIAVKPVPPPSPRAAGANSVIVVRIVDEADVVERLRIPARPSAVRRIGDEQLLKELAAANEPAGIAYVNGKAELIYK